MSNHDTRVLDTTTKSSIASSLLGVSAALPGVGAALLPAVTCPACWPAYAGLLSSIGLGFIDYTPWLMPVMVVFLLITLVALFWQSHQCNAYGPFALGVIGTMVLALGKLMFENNLTVYIYSGAGLLIVASLWNASPRKVCQVNSTDVYCD